MITDLLVWLANTYARLNVGMSVALTFGSHFGEPSPFGRDDCHDLPGGD